MKRLIHICAACITAILCGTGCSQEENPQEEAAALDNNIMRFQVIHPSQKAGARATETAFETNDRIGLFITGTDEPLQISGNYINNTLLTYNGTEWIPEKTIYWNDGTYDVYAYYPFASLSSVDEAPFSVALDQSSAGSGDELGGYEASDFLWAASKKQAAGNAAVALQFRHCMSKLSVRLVKGEDYEGDELPEDAEVYIHNTVPEATIDLSAGIVTKNTYGTEATLKAKPEGNHKYSAIIVPQRISNRKPLIEVVMKGVSYLVESTFLFKPGIQHTISVVITKNPEQVKIDIGGEIEDWE